MTVPLGQAPFKLPVSLKCHQRPVKSDEIEWIAVKPKNGRKLLGRQRISFEIISLHKRLNRFSKALFATTQPPLRSLTTSMNGKADDAGRAAEESEVDMPNPLIPENPYLQKSPEMAAGGIGAQALPTKLIGAGREKVCDAPDPLMERPEQHYKGEAFSRRIHTCPAVPGRLGFAKLRPNVM